MTELTDDIAAVLAAYQAAVYAKDVEAFVALYDTDVQVFDMWGQWSHQGIDAWRAMATGWFGSLGSEKVVVDVDALQINATPTLAAAHAFLTYTAVSAEGEKLRSMNNRLSLVLKPVGPGWKIIHQHTSAPVDFSTFKVNLQRLV